MSDALLKSKIAEWLELRKEVEGLEKARVEGVHLQNIGSKPGVSEAGSTVVLNNKAAKDRARARHQEVIEALKRMPKANLPKSEKSMTPKPTPQPTNHVWDKTGPRLTATGFLPKYKPQPRVQKPPTLKAEIQPAMVSAPVLENRVDVNGPRIIEQPNIVNPYKEIFGSLKRKGK